MNNRIQAIERGFLKGQLVFETPARWRQPDNAVRAMGIKHAQAMAAGEIDMVELEFPDCQPEDRYFRLGTNPSGMVAPIEIDLTQERKRE